MDHERVLRELYDALNRKDVARLTDLLAQDAVFHVIGSPAVAATTLTGRDQVASFLSDQLVHLEIQQEIESISEQGAFATAYVVSRSRVDGGEEQVVRWADVFQFDRDGKVVQSVSLGG